MVSYSITISPPRFLLFDGCGHEPIANRIPIVKLQIQLICRILEKKYAVP